MKLIALLAKSVRLQKIYEAFCDIPVENNMKP